MLVEQSSIHLFAEFRMERSRRSGITNRPPWYVCLMYPSAGVQRPRPDLCRSVGNGPRSVYTHSDVGPEFIRNGERATVGRAKDANAIAASIVDFSTEKAGLVHQEAGWRAVLTFAIDRDVTAMEVFNLRAGRL